MASAGTTSDGAGPSHLGPGCLIQIDTALLRPNSFQLRRAYSQARLEELAVSIRQVGLLEPICVRPLQYPLFQIIAGERRWRAAKLVQISPLPCRAFDVTEDQAFAMALAENLQRCDLSPLEEALAYQEMLDRSIAKNRAAIARLLGVSRPRITQRMKLLELDPITQHMMAEHKDIMTEYHGRLLWKVSDLPTRRRLADEVIEGRWSGRRLRAEIEEWLKEQEIGRWTSGDRSLPRCYAVSYPGFSLSVNFERADLHHVRETLRRLYERVSSLLATQGEESASGL